MSSSRPTFRTLPTEPVTSPTLGALIRDASRKWGDKTAYLEPVGSRFRPISYAELGDLVRRYATVLREWGVETGDRLLILAENSPRWAILDWACQTLGAVTVPVFPSLPADQVRPIVEDSGARWAVFGSPDQGNKLAGLAGLRTMPLTGATDSLDERARAASRALSDREWDELIEGRGPEDLAVLIYTSGTTGEPKGVMLPHRALLHVAEEARRELPLDHRDVLLSFLPMSHVFERVGQVFVIAIGATMAFSRSLLSLASELQTVRPTVMLVVPRFLEATRERILGTIERKGGLTRTLFRLAYEQNLRKVKGEPAPLAGVLDRLVLRKVRARLGGRFKFMISGGAALPPEVAEFYMAIGVLVLQGYGLTETSGGTFVNRPHRNRYWTVGEPLGMEAKIAPDGEVLIRGPGLMLGYYNRPEDTARAIDEEGWFHTGDIGEFEDGLLKITDRKKDILVLANGKNVAPQPIENLLRTSPLITEAVLFGDGMDSVCALVVPNLDEVRRRLGDAGNDGVADGELIARPEVRALVKAEIDAVNRSLASFETIRRFALVPGPFTIEGGELTPTLKVKRRVVREKYAEVIDSLR